ncbi:hypothetical protein EKK58_12580 [Candidatus Dependentiae bacterium]|nr:MAG: hypothetical protein EKK58_12580 [Candidatus Dependentiae bacterium]
MAKPTIPEIKHNMLFIQYKVGGALALLMEVDGILLEFPVYGQAWLSIQNHFTIEVVKEESTYNVINLVKKPSR